MLHDWLGDWEDRQIILPTSFKQIFQLMRQFDIYPRWRRWVHCVLLDKWYLFLLWEKYITLDTCVSNALPRPYKVLLWISAEQKKSAKVLLRLGGYKIPIMLGVNTNSISVSICCSTLRLKNYLIENNRFDHLT